MDLGRHRRIRRGLIGAALLAAHLATPAAEAWRFDIEPRGFDEHCLHLGAGEAIRWRFTATGTVDFNIHAHRGNEVIYPVRRHGVSRASGSFRSRAAEDYCLMWTNKDVAAVSLRGSVERLR